MSEKQKSLNINCKLKITIENGSFLKDADTFGKQDPFVKI
jgi:Ca2+-dependent lipid-binding protein